MAILGEVIAKYRKINNLTQSQLAEMLFVSPQAISKWEKNQSEPDLQTLNKIASIFNLTLDQFFEEAKTSSLEIEKDEDLINNAGKSTCWVCSQDFYLDQLLGDADKKACNVCSVKLSKEEELINNTLIDTKGIVAVKKRREFNSKFTPFLIGGIIGIIYLILVSVVYFSDPDFVNGTFGEYLLYQFIFAIFLSTFLTQMFYDSWLRDFFGEFMGRSMRMPGVIFELSIDGLIFLIIVKILLGFISLLIGIAIFLFGLFLSLLISPITYVFEIIKAIRGD